MKDIVEGLQVRNQTEFCTPKTPRINSKGHKTNFNTDPQVILKKQQQQQRIKHHFSLWRIQSYANVKLENHNCIRYELLT